MIKVYATADLHGKRERLQRLQSNLSILKPDLLVLAGDITNFVRASETLRTLNALALPVLMIRGNSDLKHVDRLCRYYAHCHSLQGVRRTFHKIPFVGLGGTWPLPFHSRIALNENMHLRKINALINHHTVLVTHTPPRGAQDQVMGRFHAGSRGLRRLIQTFQPDLLICGHIHEDCGVTTVGRTHVVNCAFNRDGSGALILFQDGRFVDLKMIP